jgi:excisionase family DNA binding protein
MPKNSLKRVLSMEEVQNGNAAQPTIEKRFLSVKQFETMFGIHPDTVRRGIKAGSIRFARIGDRILIPASEAERLCN